MPSTPRRDVLVLKIGGSVGAETDAALDAVVALCDGGHSLVVVHGGGPMVGQWAERLGMDTRFVRGLRVSDPDTRDLALAVLGGLANGRVVATLIARGVPAVGLTGIDGGLLRAEREDPELGLVGKVTLVDSALLEELLDAGRVPVVAPAALAQDDGEILNVNGDAAGEAIARKHHRLQALLRAVTLQQLSTQAELVRALRGAGYPATQSTVSRDIVELGLVKVARDGAHAYAPPSAATPGGGTERLRRFCEDYPVDGALAANLVVLRSLPRTAHALAAALDASRLDEAVGTLAGDDTVFIAATNERHARALLGRLTTFGIERKGTK